MVYDLIVLGGGPAGYLAAERAAQNGMTVCCVEKNRVGGVCLNEGCIPSKALLYSAKVLDYANHGQKYGVTVTGATIDQPTVIKRKQKVIDTLVGGIEMKLKKLKVELVHAEGVIGNRTAEGYTVTAGGNTYVGKRLLIASGSSPVLPPIKGLRESVASGFGMTNHEVLELTEIPARLAVIGGGVIGLEMASYYNSVGSQVTVIEMMDKIAGPTDREISDILKKNYEAKGIKFELGAKVTEVTTDSVIFERDGQSTEVKADKVLISIGRRAVTAAIGLENIGVYTERGAIVTDEQMRTNLPGVFAAGDVNGKSMLAHTAYREAEVAVNVMLGKKDKMSYDAIPAVIYTTPEVASVGMTEDQAKAQGYDAKTVKLKMMFSGRYVAENEGGDGIIKLVYDVNTNRVLGVHMIGSYASEIIMTAVLIVDKQMRIADVKKAVFPHPTVSEIIREAIFEIK